MIPKIIHHSAPEDIYNWHPLWHGCLESWYKHFPEPEYKHIMWNDNDIDVLIKDEYPEYYNLYQSFFSHIVRLDFSRFAILHSHGGIYADMDIFCFKNFYQNLKADAALIESPFGNEVVQNSMMISSKGNEFMLYCMSECLERFYQYTKNLEIGFYVKDVCGPYHISRCYEKHKKNVDILDWKRYNPFLNSNAKDIITKHMMTGLWGKETIQRTHIKSEKRKMTYENYLKDQYMRVRGIDTIQNFYKNTKGY